MELIALVMAGFAGGLVAVLATVVLAALITMSPRRSLEQRGQARRLAELDAAEVARRVEGRERWAAEDPRR